ncbi:MAG: 6-phosphogluconolactonase [Acidimicrobiales bacterium]
MIGSVVIVDDVAVAFAALVAKRMAATDSREFSLAFSGGSTARKCYESLALSTTSIEWNRLQAWWGDERCVPLDHLDSNFRLAKESLLSHIGPLAGLHPMNSAVPNAAQVYNDLVGAAAAIDLVHLGLGPDAHTASLFPGSEALSSPSGDLVVFNTDPLGSNPHKRMTFTFEGISRCRSAVITVAGEEKRQAFQRVLDGDLSAPASRIDGQDVTWLVDHEAMGPRTGR